MGKICGFNSIKLAWHMGMGKKGFGFSHLLKQKAERSFSDKTNMPCNSPVRRKGTGGVAS
jgi:hypothetical protein